MTLKCTYTDIITVIIIIIELDDDPSHLLPDQSAGELEVHHNKDLIDATKKGLLCRVKNILSKKLADINCRDRFGRTPVMEAARYGHAVVFDSLVSVGCDLEALDNSNNTVLHTASMGGNINIISKLLQMKKYDIDAKGSNLWTPVMVAAYFGHVQMFKLLASKNSNMTLKDHIDCNILHIACQGGNVDIVRYILSQNIISIDSRGYRGMTPLMVAVEAGHKKVFDFLRSKGSDLKSVDKFKQNILHSACRGGHVDIVKYIISQDIVDTEFRDNRDRTPVMEAAKHGHVGVFDFLAGYGCNLTAVDRFKNNILPSGMCRWSYKYGKAHSVSWHS